MDSCGSSLNLSNSLSNTSTDSESKTNLIVNYLPQTMTDEEFKSLFESVGIVESAKLIKNKLNNQSLCYGFVNYCHINDAETAIRNLNGLKIENKVIKVSYARPSSETIKGANLYVCGIPKSWSVENMNNYFSQCGKIITGRILLNPQNGQSRGVGFIRFDQRHEAELAINMLNGKAPQGAQEIMTVKFANYPLELSSKVLNSINMTIQNNLNNGTKLIAVSPNQLSHTALRSLANTPLPSSAHSIFPRIPVFQQNDLLQINDNHLQSTFNSDIHLYPVANVSQTGSSSGVSSMSSTSTGWTIFVYNLSQETDESILWQLFGPFGAVQSVKIVRNSASQKCKGFGFVTMSYYEDALNAIGFLNGYKLGNRVLQVSFKTA